MCVCSFVSFLVSLWNKVCTFSLQDRKKELKRKLEQIKEQDRNGTSR